MHWPFFVCSRVSVRMCACVCVRVTHAEATQSLTRPHSIQIRFQLQNAIRMHGKCNNWPHAHTMAAGHGEAGKEITQLVWCTKNGIQSRAKQRQFWSKHKKKIVGMRFSQTDLSVPFANERMAKCSGFHNSRQNYTQLCFRSFQLIKTKSPIRRCEGSVRTVAQTKAEMAKNHVEKSAVHPSAQYCCFSVNEKMQRRRQPVSWSTTLSPAPMARVRATSRTKSKIQLQSFAPRVHW